MSQKRIEGRKIAETEKRRYKSVSSCENLMLFHDAKILDKRSG